VDGAAEDELRLVAKAAANTVELRESLVKTAAKLGAPELGNAAARLLDALPAGPAGASWAAGVVSDQKGMQQVGCEWPISNCERGSSSSANDTQMLA